MSLPVLDGAAMLRNAVLASATSSSSSSSATIGGGGGNSLSMSGDGGATPTSTVTIGADAVSLAASTVIEENAILIFCCNHRCLVTSYSHNVKLVLQSMSRFASRSAHNVLGAIHRALMRNVQVHFAVVITSSSLSQMCFDINFFTALFSAPANRMRCVQG